MRSMSLLGLMIVLLLAACDTLPAVDVVPTTGDTASDAASAQALLPNLTGQGYTSTEASSIADALASVGGGGSALAGNVAVAAAIAKIDEMITCYENVGAVAARVYTRTNVVELTQGQIPQVGAMAVINRDRLARNLLPCALNTNQGGFRAQSAGVEPCGGSGSVERDGETLDYVYAATDPALCTLFAAAVR